MLLSLKHFIYVCTRLGEFPNAIRFCNCLALLSQSGLTFALLLPSIPSLEEKLLNLVDEMVLNVIACIFSFHGV